MEFALRDEWTPVDNLLSLVIRFNLSLFSKLLSSWFFTHLTNLVWVFPVNSPMTSKIIQQKKTGYDDAFVLADSHPPLNQFGNIITLNSFSLNTISVNGNGYYHEVRSNLIHKTSDLDIQNDLILFYEINKSLMAGLRYKAMTVFGTDAKSHLIAVGALVTPKDPKYRDIWCVINIGVYPEEPLFKAREYAAVLFGKEFRLGKRNNRNAQ
jgi:hypothetical protein